MNIGPMHDVTNVSPDTHPPFRKVKILHNVHLSPSGYMERDDAAPGNAVLVNLTLADGTLLSVWADGYLQVAAPESDTAQLHLISHDAAGPMVTYERTITAES